jgi:hypothetical protein
VRPRKVLEGSAFTWRFKTKDYWQAVPAPKHIETAEELMLLHQPWATSNARDVLEVVAAHRGRLSLDDEGLIVVDVDDADLEQLNAELGRLGCTLSNELLHTL